MVRLNRVGRKIKRKEGTKKANPGNYLIVTEGTKTEVNYFKNIKRLIESSFNNSIEVEKVELKVKGSGRSTTVLVNEAIKLRSYLKTYSDVWVVFDKDENKDFDEAINLAEREGLHVAWSNESFELWLLLHFQPLDTPNHRDDYIKKLNAHFKIKNLNDGEYHKNIYNIFDITFSDVDKAIKRSKSLLEYYKINNVYSPNKMNPATTVQDLVEELIKYIDKEKIL